MIELIHKIPIDNIFIALGGLLPGIGGSFTNFGYTEVLYVTELVGIIFIYIGYSSMRQDKTISIYQTQFSDLPATSKERLGEQSPNVFLGEAL